MQNTLSRVGWRWYFTLRIALVLVFMGIGVFVVVKTVFPNGGGYFDFKSYGSGKNTLADPRYENGTPIVKGTIKKGSLMILNTSASGDFSRADIDFSGTRDAVEYLGTISLVQAYRAYLYPMGEPIVCPREGSLVASGGKYKMISGGKSREFVSAEDVVARGYYLDQFMDFPSESVSQCPRGELIDVGERVIPGMLIVTDEGFFQLLDNEWVSFVSDSAFFSRYRKEDAVSVSQEVFALFPVREKLTGFADGVLVSYGESVYVTEGDMLRPIDSVDTFLSKGYEWENVVAMSGEEFGMYARGKLYTKREPHPNGTIFMEERTDAMYVVEGGTKREIAFPQLRAQFSGVHPLSASAVDLGECMATSGWLSFGCSIDWAGKERGMGAEYQLTYVAKADVTLDEMEIVFLREKNMRNLGLFLAETMGKLQSRYSVGL